MILKLAYENQIHLYRGELTIQKLKNHCQTVFKNIPKQFEFYYLDQDQDQIILSLQEDLDILLQIKENPIQKVYIKEAEAQFEDLKLISNNPEECFSEQKNQKSKNLGKDIYTINYVEEQMRIKKENELIEGSVNIFMNQMQENIVKQIILEKEQKMINEETDFFMETISSNLVQKLIEEEESLIKDEVMNFMSTKIQESSQRIAQKISDEQEQIACKRLQEKESELISKIVDDKLSKLLPTLINQIAQVVQIRISMEGCRKCQKKQSQFQFEKIIKKELLRSLQKI